MDLELKGRVALVVGATSGLGRAVATALAAEGAHVAFSGRRASLASGHAAELAHAVGVDLDVSDSGSIERGVRETEARLGPVDIVVLNSGGPPPVAARDLAPAQLEVWLGTMLLRQIELVSLLLPGMRARGWGRVLAIGSSGVQSPIADLAISNVARAGLAAYLKTLATEVAPDGVTVNMILPGRIDTERVAELDRARAERQGLDVARVREESEANIPARRYGRPSEFGAVACFLCSEWAGYMTGTQVRVDGGMHRGF